MMDELPGNDTLFLIHFNHGRSVLPKIQGRLVIYANVRFGSIAVVQWVLLNVRFRWKADVQSVGTRDYNKNFFLGHHSIFTSIESTSCFALFSA